MNISLVCCFCISPSEAIVYLDIQDDLPSFRTTVSSSLFGKRYAKLHDQLTKRHLKRHSFLVFPLIFKFSSRKRHFFIFTLSWKLRISCFIVTLVIHVKTEYFEKIHRKNSIFGIALFKCLKPASLSTWENSHAPPLRMTSTQHWHETVWHLPYCTVRTSTKALGKLGYIVVQTFVTRDVSSNVSLFAHPRNIVAETKFASWEAKMFPIKFRNISCFPSVIFVAETLFLSVCPPWETWPNIGNNVSATMFPRNTTDSNFMSGSFLQ